MVPKLDVPDPGEFRQWIRLTMQVLEINAYRWSVQAQVSPNLVSKFLSGEQNDLRLATASGLVREAVRLAAVADVALPGFHPVARQDGGRCDV
ncbi:hypothetical protein [Roseibium polysiphoniae]|uniref:XRE family transcriptional regulator n=1 Tax=Roseibium polysiphoniae TaxID=2571221 RepID=A0ABR9C7B4_9HYPH|nr:hypothetical protein [Roseibium polysiphoniae]MBD8875419.1 hypothetical protein [Roseibium polysiphoniae]